MEKTTLDCIHPMQQNTKPASELKRRLRALEFAAYSISPIDQGRSDHQQSLFKKVDRLKAKLALRVEE